MFFWPSEPPPIYSTDLNNGLESTVVDTIYGAKSSIQVSVYSLSSYKIIDALRRQAELGVEVEVVADKKASSNAAKRLGPRVKTSFIEGKGLMHHKIVVIDGKETWLGSANMTRESLRSHSNIMQKFNSVPLANFVTEKIDSLKKPGFAKRFKHRQFSIDNQAVELWFLPDDAEGSLRIKELIRNAQKTIRVAMYTFTRKDFAETLVHAANRGVHVEVIIDGSMCEGACKPIVNLLRPSKVKLYASEGKSLMHTKMMVIDDKILEQGSANWTKAAFTQNEDYFIVLYNLTSLQKNELQEIWKALLSRSKSL